MSVSQAPLPQVPRQPPRSSASHEEEKKNADIAKQQRWLLFLLHASRCEAEREKGKKCTFTSHCATARELIAHVKECKDVNCTYSRCKPSKNLLNHFKRCKDESCAICQPIRRYLRQEGMKKKVWKGMHPAKISFTPQQKQLYNNQHSKPQNPKTPKPQNPDSDIRY